MYLFTDYKIDFIQRTANIVDTKATFYEGEYIIEEGQEIYVRKNVLKVVEKQFEVDTTDEQIIYWYNDELSHDPERTPIPEEVNE